MRPSGTETEQWVFRFKKLRFLRVKQGHRSRADKLQRFDLPHP
jgi:hypothetical protein